MRKMIWSGTALLICGAVAVFCAARYAAENPDSFLGRCANAAYSVAVRCNAIGALTRAAPTEPIAAGKAIPGAVLPIPPADVPADENQEPPLADPGQRPEVAEPIVVDAPEDAGADLAERPPLTAPVQKDLIEKDDFALERDFAPLPKIMPYADDEGGSAESAQARDCCFGQFFSWLLSGPEACEKQQSCPACGLVQSIVDYVSALLEEESEAAEEAEVPPPPEAVSPTGNDEPQENGHGRGAFREDPYYHHQYPSCPYTGGCPYPHSYTVPPVRPMEKRPNPSPNQPSTEPMQKHMSLKISPDRPLHPEIDTMECRPTDVPDAESEETY